MRLRLKYVSLASAGFVALALSLPVMGQNSPESLLPPGFGDPAPAPAPSPSPSPAPRPSPAPSTTPAPGPVANSGPSGSGSTGAIVRDPGNVPDIALRPPSALLDMDLDTDIGELDELLQPQYSLPPGQRRSMAQIGVLAPESGGISTDGFGEEGGEYLTSLIKGIRGPIVSRWSSILLRRVLLSKVDSPANVNPADWVAARAWQLLRMGEAEAARSLVLKVDGDNFTPRLYEVAMQAHLATADPAGICPYVPGGLRASDAPTWIMFRPICASLRGEQTTATSLLRAARRDKAATGIDYLLAEKTIGAGFDGRRAVTIKWEEVENFNNWRYGLGNATGVEPPDRLYALAGNHVQGWRVSAPMLAINSRLDAADTASALGVLSNRAMVDLYSAAYDDPDVSDDWKAQASTLRQAYTSGTSIGRIQAMKALWNRSANNLTSYSNMILTARAAARIPAAEELVEDVSALLASMLSAGLDRNAARWATIVEEGSDGWALLAAGAPENAVAVDYGALDDFGDQDESAGQLRSKLLLAAVAGLGRADAETVTDFASDLELDLNKTSRWTKAIQSASRRGQVGTVAVLAAVGMQGRNWRDMSPLHLFHVTQTLKRVGLEAEARMIAAEALSRT